MTRYVIYDFDADELVTSRVFDTYEEAADVANECDNAMVVALNVPEPQNMHADESDS